MYHVYVAYHVHMISFHVHVLMYLHMQVFIQELAGSLHLFLADHGKQFAEQLWRFLHAGLTVTAYDKLIFGDDDPVLELDERQGDLIDASSDHNYREW